MPAVVGLLSLASIFAAGACSDTDAAVLSATGAATDCVRPELSSSRLGVFWDSYSAYRARMLTVSMSGTNYGSNTALDVKVTGIKAGSSVVVITPVPLSVAGSLAAGDSATYDIELRVPHGVASFLLSTFMSAQDSCGNHYDYPPPGGTEPAGDTIFPPDNIWHTRIDTLPVDANSDLYIQTIGADEIVHPDFGSGLWEGGPIGIPYVEVPGDQPRVPVSFEYADESDPGPYPVPPDAPVEGGPDSDGDRHILLLDRESNILYELYYAWPQPDGSWYAGSGAIYDLDSNALRPDGWTSADAAGLPIFPALVRYDEVAAGEIKHALRFTAPQTRRAYVWPARHFASSVTGPQYPPMGQRFRLKAGYDISGFSPRNQVILTALKRYGMFLADNGAAMYLGGAPDERWDNGELRELRQLTAADFEAVDTSPLIIDPDSGQARQD